MKKFLMLYVLVTALNLLAASGSAAAAAEKKVVTVAYFYINPCASCDEARRFTDGLDKFEKPEYIDIRYEMYNTYHLSSYNLLQEYFSAYHVPDGARNVPIAFVGDAYLSGEDEIKSRLIDEILKARDPVPVSRPGEKNEKLPIYSVAIGIPLLLITALAHKGKGNPDISGVVRSKMLLISLLLFVALGTCAVFYF